MNKHATATLQMGPADGFTIPIALPAPAMIEWWQPQPEPAVIDPVRQSYAVERTGHVYRLAAHPVETLTGGRTTRRPARYVYVARAVEERQRWVVA